MNFSADWSISTKNDPKNKYPREVWRQSLFVIFLSFPFHRFHCFDRICQSSNRNNCQGKRFFASFLDSVECRMYLWSAFNLVYLDWSWRTRRLDQSGKVILVDPFWGKFSIALILTILIIVIHFLLIKIWNSEQYCEDRNIPFIHLQNNAWH